MTQRTITINGTVYDAHTGLPVTELPHSSHTVESSHIHARTQRSQTLNRRVVTPKPTARKISVQVNSDVVPQSQPVPQGKSPMIQKFATRTETPRPVQEKPKTETIAPIPHPITTKILQKQPATATAAPINAQPPTPSTVLKQQAIADAMSNSPDHNAKKQRTKTKKQFGRFAQFFRVASAALGLLILGGYFTYLNMPNLSIRVAAAQAGMHATYPAYKPDGYSLSGPIAYQQGSVAMNFASNGSPMKYTLTQNKSSWDSTAVLDNYITPRAKNKYDTTRENGLTIYTYGSNAAWVNGGILYTIEGDAPLSSDQIRRIAASL